jgi:hypothetical protein
MPSNETRRGSNRAPCGAIECHAKASTMRTLISPFATSKHADADAVGTRVSCPDRHEKSTRAMRTRGPPYPALLSPPNQLVRLVLFPLLATLLCGCRGAAAAPHAARCIDTAAGLDCEAMSAPVTCAPPLPEGSPCVVMPPVEATEDARNAEVAIQADLGVAATVRSFEVRQGIRVRKVVLVRLDRMPPTGDTGHVWARVSKNVREVFRARVDALAIVLADSRERLR